MTSQEAIFEYSISHLEECDLPDLDAALLEEYGDLCRHSVPVLRACVRWDPDGWFVAKVSGKCVGFIAGCLMNESEALNGYYVVLPHFRRRGIGKALWDRLMTYVAGRTLCVTSVESSYQRNIERGFKNNPFNVLCVRANPQAADFYIEDIEIPSDMNLVTYSPEVFDDVMVYDTSVHTVPRQAFLRQWLDTRHTMTYILYRDQHVVGYGSAQQISSGLMMIAPVFADDDVIADVILRHLYNHIRKTERHLVMDIIEQNDFMRKNRSRLDITIQSREYRLYNGTPSEVRIEKAYVLTTDSFSLV